MRTEADIRNAEKILSDAAAVEKDHETYEVVANLAMALKWVLGDDNGVAVDHVLSGAKMQAIMRQAKNN